MINGNGIETDPVRLADMELSKLKGRLFDARDELRDWCYGRRSTIGDMMAVEPGYENRQATLVATAQADAAEIQAAIRRVEGLEKLIEGVGK